MKENRKYFIVEVSPDLQKQMRLAKSIHGINWGFVLREAIQQYIRKAEKESATA